MSKNLVTIKFFFDFFLVALGYSISHYSGTKTASYLKLKFFTFILMSKSYFVEHFFRRTNPCGFHYFVRVKVAIIVILEFLDCGRACWTLDSGDWSLDVRRCPLDVGFRTLDNFVDWFRTEAEPSFKFCLIKLLNSLWVRISKDLMVTLILYRV